MRKVAGGVQLATIETGPADCAGKRGVTECREVGLNRAQYQVFGGLNVATGKRDALLPVAKPLDASAISSPDVVETFFIFFRADDVVIHPLTISGVIARRVIDRT